MYLHSQVHCTIIGNSQDLEQPKGPSGASQVELVVRACLPVRRCKRHSFNPWVRKIPWRRAWHSSILAWRIPWTEEPGGLCSNRGAWRAMKQLSTAQHSKGPSTDEWIKQKAHEYYLLLKKKDFSAICENLAEFEGHSVKWNNPDAERQILHDLTYMWSLFKNVWNSY